MGIHLLFGLSLERCSAWWRFCDCGFCSLWLVAQAITPESQISPATLRGALLQHANSKEKSKVWSLGETQFDWAADTSRMILKPSGPTVHFMLHVFKFDLETKGKTHQNT